MPPGPDGNQAAAIPQTKPTHPPKQNGLLKILPQITPEVPFPPNRLTRPMTSPRTLALVGFSHLPELLQGAAEWVRENGCELDIGMLAGNDLPEDERDWDWHGVIAYVSNAEQARWVLRQKCPVVRVLPSPAPLADSLRHLPHVDCDYDAAGAAGALHLLTLGTPAFAFYRRGHGEDALHLRNGFLRTMRSAGIEPALIDFPLENPDVPAGARVPRERRLRWLSEKLSALPKPLALMAEDSRFALDVLAAAERLGLSVPCDVAVVCYGESAPLQSAARTEISTVDCNLRALGRHAAQQLGSLIAGDPAPQGPVIVRSVRTLARGSTATYAGANRQADEALRIARLNFRSPEITTASVAARLGLSAAGLRKILLRETGRSLCDELRHLRLEAACRLLADSELKLDAIAAEVGLGDAKNLCRVFRKAKGMTPDRWRRVR